MPSPSTKSVRGVEVPTIGFGVFEVDPGETGEAVADALRAGYRHVDTAKMYDNEGEVGRGIAESGVDRDDIWVTTKVWMGDLAPKALRQSAENSLRLLDLDHVDLLLIHWPPEDPAELGPALGELRKLREEGKIGQLGVSNFPAYMLEDALAIEPGIFANQVEYHAKLSQQDLLDVAARHDVLIEAYAPLSGSAGDLVDEPLLAEIAEAHDASPGQIALAWLARQDRVVLLPRSTKPERRRENLAALEIDLSDDETAKVDELSRRRERGFDPGFAPDWRD